MIGKGTLLNVLYGYLGYAVYAVMTFGSLALYSRLFGSEEWSIAASLLAASAIFSAFDFGLGQKYIADHRRDRTQSEYFVYLLALLLIIGINAVIALFGIWMIGSIWKGIVPPYGWDAVVLGVAYAMLNSANNLYYSHLNIKQRQLAQNIQWNTFFFIKVLLAILLAKVFGASAVLLILAYVMVSLVEFLLNNFVFLKFKMPSMNVKSIISVLFGAKWLGFAIFLGMLAISYDRVVWVGSVDARVFKGYAILVSLTGYLVQFQRPVINVFFPLYAELHGAGLKKQKMNARIQSALSLSILLPVALLLYLFRGPVFLFFNVSYDGGIYRDVFAGLLIGAVINGVTSPYYQRVLIRRRYLYLVMINGLMLVFSVIYYYQNKPDLVQGASWYWVIMYGIQGVLVLLFSEKRASIVNRSRKLGQLVKLIKTIKTSSHHETNTPEIQRRIQSQSRT